MHIYIYVYSDIHASTYRMLPSWWKLPGCPLNAQPAVKGDRQAVKKRPERVSAFLPMLTWKKTNQEHMLYMIIYA